MAWYAMHDALGGDPAEMLAWAADTIAAKLGAFGRGVANPLPSDQAEIAVKEAQWLLGMIAEIFGRCDLPPDDEARLAFKATLTRVRRGALNKANPVLPQSLAWWGHAAEVESLMAGGLIQKKAVGEIAERLNVKDAVVAQWVRDRRKALTEGKARFSDLDN